MANQLRNWVLTINNPSDDEEKTFEYIKGLPHIKYFIFQREKGEETGTEHYQLYIEFQVGKTFDTMKKYFPTAHIEQRKGTKTQARDYCSKAETRISDKVYEFGTFAEERERSDLNDIIEMVKDGSSDEEILSAYPSQFFRYSKHINDVRQTVLQSKFKNIFRNLDVTYIWGRAGVGKTRYVMDKFGFENVYRLTSYDRGCFDSYKGEDVILFDEFRSSFKITDMLNYLDGYPLMLPSRYSNKVACYTKVYIISNIPFEEQYIEFRQNQPATFAAFKRRIHHFYEMSLSGIVEAKQLRPSDLPEVDDDLPF